MERLILKRFHRLEYFIEQVESKKKITMKLSLIMEDILKSTWHSLNIETSRFDGTKGRQELVEQDLVMFQIK